jgi:hypothetical protein
LRVQGGLGVLRAFSFGYFSFSLVQKKSIVLYAAGIEKKKKRTVKIGTLSQVSPSI